MLSNEEVAAIEDMADWDPDHPMAKFCNDPQSWYREAMQIAIGLGLETEGGLPSGCHAGRYTRPLKIYDLGCGFGYFVRVCSDLGHNAEGLDRGGPPMLGGANDILGNKFVSGGIQPGYAIPDDFQEADLITMFGVMFRHGSAFASRDYWGWPEYTFLARDICSRLRPGGRLVIRPNDTGGDGKSFAHLRDANEWSAHIGAFATVSRTGRREVTITPKGPNDD